MRIARAFGFVGFALLLTATIVVPAVRAQRTMPADVVARNVQSAAEQKISPTVMSEIHLRRGDLKPVTPARNGAVRIDRHGRALVAVRAQVKPELQKKIRALGGVVVSTSGPDNSIVSWMPLLTIERLAADQNVRAIAAAQ